MEVLVGRVLRGGVTGAKLGRRAGAELIAGRKYPWMPCACQRSNRFGTAPDTGHPWKRAAKHLIGAVCLCIRDSGLSYLSSQIHATDHVARKRNASEDARLARLVGHLTDGRGLIRKKIGEHRCGRPCSHRVFRGIRRARGWLHDRGDCGVDLTRVMPHVCVFRIPGGNRRVINCRRH